MEALKEERLISAKELADYLNLDEDTVKKMALASEIPGYRVSARRSPWRFSLREVLESLRYAAAS